MSIIVKVNPNVDVDSIPLLHGSHASRAHGVCFMELVSWLANEEHSDHPECVSEFLGSLFRQLQDGLGMEERQELKRYLTPVIGTRDGADLERVIVTADWAVRTLLPAVLLQSGIHAQAAQFLAVEAITTQSEAQYVFEAVDGALASVRDVHSDAYEMVYGTTNGYGLRSESLVNSVSHLGKMLSTVQSIRSIVRNTIDAIPGDTWNTNAVASAAAALGQTLQKSDVLRPSVTDLLDRLVRVRRCSACGHTAHDATVTTSLETNEQDADGEEYEPYEPF